MSCLFVGCLFSSAKAQFTLEDFILWDYRDGAPVRASDPTTVSLPKYHEWLLTYCQGNTPPRLLLYITDPCSPDASGEQGWLNFYDPTAGITDSNGNMTFVGFLKQLQPIVDDMEILIDLTSFSSSITPDPENQCWNGSPSGATLEPTWLPPEFSRLPNTMGWLEALMSNAHLQGANPVQALALDPEGSGGSPEYVNIMLWLDKYKSTVASPAVRALDISMTLGFEAHTVVKNCIAELPAPLSSGSSWPGTLWDTCKAPNSSVAAYYSQLQVGNGYLPWRSSTEPLLQRAYLQVYSACIAARTPGSETSEFWRFSSAGTDCDCTDSSTYTISDGATIASNLVDVMQRIPAACGKGTIEAVVSNKTITLNGTNSIMPFMEGHTRLFLNGASGPIPSSGVWKYKLGDPPTQDTAVVSGVAQSSSNQSVPYTYTEISIDFRSPEMTDTSPDRIVLMFSAEKGGLLPFFGWGAPADFYSFATNFYNSTQATSPTSSVFMGSNGGIPVQPNRFALYDLKQMCTNWNLGPYGSIPCIGDGTQDGVVNSADVLHAINYWGTNETNADHDENGTVDIKDLLIVIHSWGLCG